MSDDFTKKQDFYLWKNSPVQNHVQELKKLHETQGVAITTIYDVNKGTLPQYNSDIHNRNILNNNYHHVVGSIVMSNGLDGNDHAQLIVSNIEDSPLVKAMVLKIDENTKVNSSYAFSFGRNRDEQNAIFETTYKQLEGTGKATRISGKDIDELKYNWYAKANLRKEIHLSLNNQNKDFLNEFIDYVEFKTDRTFLTEKRRKGILGVYLTRINGWSPLFRGSVGSDYADVDSNINFSNNDERLLGGSLADVTKKQNTSMLKNTIYDYK